jgi:hypothetical protein
MRQTIYIILTIFLTACKTQHLAVIKLNDKFGCIDRKGNIVIQPTWDYILQGDKNKQLLVEKDSLYGFIDSKGKIIIRPQYQDAVLFSDGLAAVSNGKKYGFVNLKGDTVIPFLYDETIMGFNNVLSDVTLNDSCGYINKQGKIVVAFIYETCYPFMSNYAQVETFDGDEFLIDKKGKKYDEDDVNEKHRLWVPREVYPGSFTTSTGQGRINIKGDTIVPPIFKVTGNLSDRMYIVQDKSNKWGAYNDKGQFTVKCKFDEIWHFSEGLANFNLNGKWGFVDKKGQIIIEPIFEYASQFTNGLAYAEINGKSGFINKKGTFVIKPKFEINKGSRFE